MKEYDYESVVQQGRKLGSGLHGITYEYEGVAVKLSRELAEANRCRPLVGHRMRHVVRYLGVNETQGSGRTYFAIAMELLVPLDPTERDTVAKCVPQYHYARKGVDWKILLDQAGKHAYVVKQVHKGIQALRRKGIIHDDVHSDNVMKTATGIIKVIDLSIEGS